MEIIPDDDDDLRLFQPLVGDESAAKIIRIKHNDPDTTKLEMWGVSLGGRLDEDASQRLGDILGQSSHVKDLIIRNHYHLTNTYVTELLNGLQDNNSIEKIAFVSIELQTANMRSLASFLNHRRLTNLALTYSNIGSESFRILFDAFVNHQTDSLKFLDLSGNDFTDFDWDVFIDAFSGCRNLQSLTMDFCTIGLKGYNALAQLLRHQNSNLARLDLSHNPIYDESVIVLADSLAKNSKLKVLGLCMLSFNGKFTERGCKAMLRLVCDTSSIDAVIKSNNTLKILLSVYDRNTLRIADDCLGIDDANLLKAALKVNGASNKNLVAKRKLIWAHARGDLNLADSPIPSAVMPDMLSWFSNTSGRTGAHLAIYMVEYQDPPRPKARVESVRLDSIYRIIQWKPWFCVTSIQVSKLSLLAPRSV